MRSDEELREAYALMSNQDIEEAAEEAREQWDQQLYDEGLQQLSAPEVDHVLKMAELHGTVCDEGRVRCLTLAIRLKQPPRSPDWRALMDGDLALTAPGDGMEVKMERRGAR